MEPTQISTKTGSQTPPKTVLITGASSGIGRTTALYFQRRGWQVAATMRSPEQASELAALPGVLCLRLDVTEPESIADAIATTHTQLGPINVVLNNAGYALTGPFETCTPAQIERQFATNVFGTMAVIRAILPHFRSAQDGTIINIASIGGQMAFPLYSLYHATKWSVEGFSESLQYELRPWNIRVKIIEPGPIQTDFHGRSADAGQSAQHPAYDTWATKVMARLLDIGNQGSPPEVVAQTIYKAATDGSKRLRYPAGGQAKQLLLLRKLLPGFAFRALVDQIVVR